MTHHPVRDDLVLLVADKNMEFTVKGLLTRHRSLGTRAISATILVDPHRDSGRRTRSPEILRPYINRCSFGVVMFDHEGCGEESKSRQELEAQVEKQLAKNGWSDRARAIVISPELENWVGSDSPFVDKVSGWTETDPSLRKWLIANEWLKDGTAKPERPKEAFEAVLQKTKQPRSSALYQQLSKHVDFSGCQDLAFLKLKTCLQTWFAAPQ